MTLGKPATGLPRYYMDCGWWRHRAFVGLPAEALVLYQAIISYGYEHATDGHAPAHPEDLSAAVGLRVSLVRKGLAALLQKGRLLEDAGEVVVVGWSDHNPTRVEMAEHAKERSEAGGYGNHERWHVQRGKAVADCRWCIAGAIGEGSPSESHGMGWDGMGDPPPESPVTQDPLDSALAEVFDRYAAGISLPSDCGNPEAYRTSTARRARVRHTVDVTRWLTDFDITPAQAAAALVDPKAKQGWMRRQDAAS